MVPGRGVSALDRRTVAGLVFLSLAAHFIPLSRPGFQPDDFFFQHLALVEPAWSFVGRSLDQPVRPLCFLLVTLIPHLFGLAELPQLTILIASTTFLTIAVYALLADLFERDVATFAAVVFVVWPVKHEIYAAQLFGINNLAAILIVVAALLYRRWLRSSRPVTLGLSVACYAASILIYEIGYLAPLVFLLFDRPDARRFRALSLFAVPAASYWVLRFTSNATPIGGGTYPVTLETLLNNLVTSLPSSLFGFQVVRNIAYGLWGLLNAPIAFQVWCAFSAAVTVLAVKKAVNMRTPNPDVRGAMKIALLSLVAAAMLMAPAAMVLVESRHSLLGAVGIAIVVAELTLRLRPRYAAAVVVVLLLSSQGLAQRQAEISRLQATVRQSISERRDEFRAADAVVVDIKSLAERIPYTWGERRQNVLRAYWGMSAFNGWGFQWMVINTQTGSRERDLVVRTCAAGLVVSPTVVQCGQNSQGGTPFTLDRAGTVVIDFKDLPLP